MSAFMNVICPSEKIFTTPSEKNFTDNNTVINNTNNITVNKKEIYKEKSFAKHDIYDS